MNGGKKMKEQIEGRISTKIGFYIGDVCYVLSRRVYGEIFQPDNKAHDGVIHDPISDHDFMVASTAYGDGCYKDQYGHQYPVDAGNIGIVPAELIDPEKVEIYSRLGHTVNTLGLYVEGSGMASFGTEDGVFDIHLPGGKYVNINTK